MDIHDIALTLFAQLVQANGTHTLSDDDRTELGREAYRYAQAFITAKDLYIRELPTGESNQGF